MLRDLWSRRVPHAAAVYFGAGSALVGILDFIANREILAPWTVDFALVLFGAMLPSVLVVAWFHGSRGTQRLESVEAVFVPLNLLGALGLYAFVMSGAGVSEQLLEVSKDGRLTFLEATSITDVKWSPDGKQLAVLTRDSLGSHLLRLNIDSDSPPDTLVTFTSAGSLSWTADEGIRVWAALDSVRGALLSVADDGRVEWSCDTPICARVADGTSVIASTTPRPDTLTIWSVDTRSAGSQSGGLTSPKMTPVRTLSLREETRWLLGVATSPAGPLVAVVRQGWRSPGGGESSRLDILDLDSGEQWEVAVTPAGTRLLIVRWSRDGRALDYLEGRFLRRARLVSPTEGQVAADDPLGLIASWPNGQGDLSPNGKDAVYSRSVRYRASVRAIDLHADTLAHGIALQAPSATQVSQAISVSPDGEEISYFDLATPNGLAVWNRRSGSVRLVMIEGLRSPDGRLTQPGKSSWSPKGTNIAVRLAGAQSRTIIIDPTGNQPAKEVGVGVGGDLTWCTEDVLLYQVPENNDYVIYNMGSDTRRLLFGGKQQGWMSSAACSPDGRTIAFNYNHSRTRGLWLIDRETGEGRVIVADPTGIAPIGWSSDGAWIYYYKLSSMPFGIHRVPSSGGTPELVVRLPRHTIWPSGGGADIAMSRDGSTLATIERDIRMDVFLARDFAKPPAP